MQLLNILQFRRLAILVVIALAILIRYILFQTTLANIPANADEILNFMQARDIARGNFYLFFWTQPYQFPFEAYLMSLVVDYLPWTTLGVRLVPISVCLLAIVGFCFIFKLLGRLDTTWLGYLLILLPSSYWLMRQVALMTPQHAMTVTFMWLLPLILGLSQRSARPHYWCLFGGIVAGAALSNHLLLLSLVAPCSLALCLGRSAREASKNTLLFIPGFLFGLAPYLYAKLFVPRAYERVAETISPRDAIGRIWDPVIIEHVTTSFGISTWIWPDTIYKIKTFNFLNTPAAILFCVLLVFLIFVRAYKFFRRFKQDSWPTIELNDVFLATACLAIFLMSMTGMGLRTRYALPVLWSLPFLLSYAYAVLPRFGRVFVGGVAVTLAVINVSHSFELRHIWRQPNFAQDFAVTPDLVPLYNYFEKHKVTRCYTGWWLAYRIIFDSKEKIICSPPFNDRFAGWPQPGPYREIVDMEKNIPPYVESTYTHLLLRTGTFEPYLLHHNIGADRKMVGEFVTYRNFHHQDVTSSKVVDFRKLSAADKQSQLIDNDISTVWRSNGLQQTGMLIEFELANLMPLHAVRLLSLEHEYSAETLPRLRVELKTKDGTWRTVKSDSAGHPHLIRLDPEFPRYYFDGLQLMIGFAPEVASAIRISIEKPAEDRKWEIAEVHLFTGTGEN